MTRKIYRIVALCLTLAWGPATMCCALEAAGWDVMCSDAACHEDEPAKAKTDGCSVVEEGQYQSAVQSLKMGPPFATVSECLISAKILEFQSQRHAAMVEAEIGRPRDWVPGWQFERRAAALAHAPDAMIA